MTWDMIVVGSLLLMGAAGCLCLAVAGIRNARGYQRWQSSLAELGRPEARVRVFGEWRDVDGE